MLLDLHVGRLAPYFKLTLSYLMQSCNIIPILRINVMQVELELYYRQVRYDNVFPCFCLLSHPIPHIVIFSLVIQETCAHTENINNNNNDNFLSSLVLSPIADKHYVYWTTKCLNRSLPSVLRRDQKITNAKCLGKSLHAGKL